MNTTATVPSNEQTLSPPQRSDFPALYMAASDCSRNGQRSYKRLILSNLLLLVLAAVLSALSGLVQNPYDGLFTIAIVAVLLGAMATNFLNRELQGDRDWFEGRAVAESVKTNVWRYMMRVPPFRDDRASDRTFASRLKAIQIENKSLNQNLASLPTELHQITDRMRTIRELDWEDRRTLYARERLVREIEWYRTKGTTAAIAARNWRWASFGAEFAGVLIALSTFVLPISVMINLVGVIASLAAAFEAWTQVSRHSELSQSYNMACQELIAIRDLMAHATTETGFITAVKNSEGAISREHTMWVAKRAQ